MLKDGTVEKNLIDAIDTAIETWASIIEDIEDLESRGFEMSINTHMEIANYRNQIKKSLELKRIL